MLNQWKSKLKKINLFSMCIPATLLITSALVPLKPFTQQAFMCVLLIWFQVTAILSFNIWLS